MSTEETTPPRRLRAQDVIDAQQATIERLTAPRAITASASCELTRNAKGETQIGVKATGETAAEASASAEAEYDRLCRKYPSASGFVRNDGDAGK